MKRRKMLQLTLKGTIAAAVLYGSWKSYGMFKSPDIFELDENHQLLDALCETIIPRTNTPGASDAKVYRYVILTLKENTTRVDQNNFIDGLVALRSHAISQFQLPFEMCSLDQKEETLSYFEEKGTKYEGTIGKIQTKVFGTSFFDQLKKLTVQGFCTSMEGCTKALAYDPTPGEYINCAPLIPDQKAWATK
jgi:hypothetical protein